MLKRFNDDWKDIRLEMHDAVKGDDHPKYIETMKWLNENPKYENGIIIPWTCNYETFIYRAKNGKIHVCTCNNTIWGQTYEEDIEGAIDIERSTNDSYYIVKQCNPDYDDVDLAPQKDLFMDLETMKEIRACEAKEFNW